MNFQLVPILLCAILCTTRNCFQEIDMTKLYNITTTVPNPTAGGTPIVRNITEKLAGLFVCFDNDEESIIIKVNNGPDDVLAQDTTITISPQDNTKPNLLTIKTYEDLRSTITINENDNGQIVIALTRSSPEGEFLLTYNGEVDVRLTSDPSTITTAQTYNFSNPLFLDQLITPVVTSTDRDNFRLNNVTAINKLLYEFDQTFRLIRRLFERREVPKHSIYNLCSLYNAEKTRHCLARCCEKKNVVTVNVVGECDDFDFVDKFEVEEVCKPKVCFKEDEYSLCIINAVAVNVLFETFNFTGDCSKDALAKYAKTIIAIKSCIDVREAAVILYNAVNVFTKVGSRQREAYTSCVSSLNIDLPCLSKTYCNNNNINNAISGILLETETEVGLEVCDKESTKEESSEECEDEDSETSSSDKKQPTGMSNKKKLMIAGGVVVVAVVVTVSAVVFFT